MCPCVDGIPAVSIGSILNYLLPGLPLQIDRFYLRFFKIFLTCTVVFLGVGNIGFTLLKYDSGNFFPALSEIFLWILLFSFEKILMRFL
jgi:hypothetical protein